jgi:hypothetical protein
VTDNSSYPVASAGTRPSYTLPLPPGVNDTDPSKRTNLVQSMEPAWDPIDICLGGTFELRARSRDIIPQEPREDTAAYNRRIFHATLPPFLTRLASQAAGIILRKGIELDGDPYWTTWSANVTGDGTTLNEYARRQLVTSILYGHSSTIVDFVNNQNPRNLAEERALARQPYLVPVSPHQILGWRTSNDSWSSALEQVRIRETIVTPAGRYGEEITDQIRVLEPGRYELWRPNTPTTNLPVSIQLPGPTAWEIYESGTTSISNIPLVTVYSNRKGNLLSAPPLLEVAQLNIAYAQRFCDYHHSIHVGASPILVLRGFDPDSDSDLGLSINSAILLPPDGGAEYVEPTSDAFDAQLKCLAALEDQISRLGINTLTTQNLTNAAAESKRMDRIDSDSIMAVISGDLERSITEMLTIAAQYIGIEPPTVTIPRDYENRLLDGNQITAYLQLFMQGAISQETLLTILQQGEVLPTTIDIPTEITKTKEYLEEQQAMDRLNSAGADLAFQSSTDASDITASRNAGQGESLASQTLPTPLRSGRNE